MKYLIKHGDSYVNYSEKGVLHFCHGGSFPDLIIKNYPKHKFTFSLFEAMCYYLNKKNRAITKIEVYE